MLSKRVMILTILLSKLICKDMIEIKGLTKKYDKTWVLYDFNLSIPDGSIFGLIGINGAGKSTLLRLLSGVLRADGGDILIDGENIFENEKKKNEIFFLPDELFYTIGMNGLQLVEFYKTFYNFDETIFKDFVNAYKLNLSAPLRTFSKGMRRQLFVCLAFASAQKYLFLDEVFDGLDPAARLIFKRGLIEFIARTGGTAILSSHSLRELEDICDSYGFIDGRKIMSSGNISDSIGAVHKFQIAFNRVINREELGFDCLSFETSGRIIRVVVKGDKEDYIKKIEALNPLVIDEMSVDFEEFFISELKAKGERI